MLWAPARVIHGSSPPAKSSNKLMPSSCGSIREKRLAISGPSSTICAPWISSERTHLKQQKTASPLLSSHYTEPIDPRTKDNEKVVDCSEAHSSVPAALIQVETADNHDSF